MRRVSLLFNSNNTAGYSGNEPIMLKNSDSYGSEVFTWNVRFNNLINEFFMGTPLHNLTDTSHDILEKYIQYADSVLSETDREHTMIQDYDSYLATL